MVVSSVIEHYVTRICGRWIRNFNKDKIQASIVSGTITLSDVEINTDELQEFLAPFTPKFIYLGKLFLDIPLLPNRPLIMEISEVYFLHTAQDLSKIPPETLRKALQVQIFVHFIQRRIQDMMLEEYDRANSQLGSKSNSSARRNLSRRLPHMIQQMRLNVRHVHFRIEQEATPTVSAPFFAFGAVLRELRMVPTDEISLIQGSTAKLQKPEEKSQEQNFFQKLFAKKPAAQSPETVEVKEISSLDKTFVLKDVEVYWSNDNAYQGLPTEIAVGLMKTGVSVTASVVPLLIQTSILQIQAVVALHPQPGRVDTIGIDISLGELNVEFCNTQLEFLLIWFDYLYNFHNKLQVLALGFPDIRFEKKKHLQDKWKRVIKIVQRQVNRCRVENQDQTARWRECFREWVVARRYVAIRELLQRYLVVRSFVDPLGNTHSRMYEGLSCDPLESYSQLHELQDSDVQAARKLLEDYLQQTIDPIFNKSSQASSSRVGSEQYILSVFVARALHAMQMAIDGSERLLLCAGARALAESRLRFQRVLNKCLVPGKGLLLLRVLSAENMPSTSWVGEEALVEGQIAFTSDTEPAQKKVSTSKGSYNSSQNTTTWNQTLRFITPAENKLSDQESFSLTLEVKSQFLMIESSCGFLKLSSTEITSKPVDIVTHNIQLQTTGGLRLFPELENSRPVLNLITVYFPSGSDPAEVEPIERAIQMMGAIDQLSLQDTIYEKEEDAIHTGHRGPNLMIRQLVEIKAKLTIGLIVGKFTSQDAGEEGMEPGFTPLVEARVEEIRGMFGWEVQQCVLDIKAAAKRIALIDHQASSGIPWLELGPVSAHMGGRGGSWSTLCTQNPTLPKLLENFFQTLPWDLTVTAGSYSAHLKDAPRFSDLKKLWQRDPVLSKYKAAVANERFNFLAKRTAVTSISTTKQNRINSESGAQDLIFVFSSLFRALELEMHYKPQGLKTLKSSRWSFIEQEHSAATIKSVLDSGVHDSEESNSNFEIDQELVNNRIKELEEEIEKLKALL